MAVPKKKLSRSRRDRRRAHTALDKLHLIHCPTCYEWVPPHQVCPSCGEYKGVAYIEVEEEVAE